MIYIVSAKSDFAIGEHSVPAGEEIAVILIPHDACRVGTLTSILKQSHLVDVSEADPGDLTFALGRAVAPSPSPEDAEPKDWATVVAELEVDELEKLREALSTVSGDDVHDAIDDSMMTPEGVHTVTADSVLADIMDVAAIGRDVPTILAENNIETAGELREWLAAEDGRSITQFKGVGPGYAAKALETTFGLADFLASPMDDEEPADAETDESPTETAQS
ncbi:MAG: hypothetical protein AAFX06_21350 [Planctomycetota bacterium]